MRGSSPSSRGRSLLAIPSVAALPVDLGDLGVHNAANGEWAHVQARILESEIAPGPREAWLEDFQHAAPGPATPCPSRPSSRWPELAPACADVLGGRR